MKKKIALCGRKCWIYIWEQCSLENWKWNFLRLINVNIFKDCHHFAKIHDPYFMQFLKLYLYILRNFFPLPQEQECLMADFSIKETANWLKKNNFDVELFLNYCGKGKLIQNVILMFICCNKIFHMTMR